MPRTRAAPASAQLRSPAPAKARPFGHLEKINLRDFGLAAFLCGATLLAYWPSLHGGLIWDDTDHVTRPELRSLHGLWRIWSELGATPQYYPLLHSAFWLEHRFWMDATLGYHLVNLVLHVVAALLVVAVVRRLALPGAWMAGFIFALHPVCVNSVAWISEQKNTLSTVFYLSSALAYLSFDRSRRRAHYVLALALFVMALLSKTVTATLPAALLVVFWWQRGRMDWRRDVKPLLPWFAIGSVAGIFTAWVEYKFIGAAGSDFSLTLSQRCLVAGRVIWFYLGKLVWPRELVFIYPRWMIDQKEGWQYLFPLAALLLAGGLAFLARRHRGLLAAFLLFVGTLFPVLGFLNVYPFTFSFVADHFQYLASLGLIVPLSVGLTLAIRRIPVAVRWLGVLPAGLLLVTLGLLTWRQSYLYSDAETIYRDTLLRNPGCWVAHNNLGSELLDVPGRLQEATAHFETALDLKPDYADAHNNLGNALLRIQGRTPDAISQYEAALRLRPAYAEAHNNLGNALLHMGRIPEAIQHFEAALRILPNYASAHNNLGMALLYVPDRTQDAIAQFEAALQIDENLAAAHTNLASVLSKIPGRSQEAIPQYEAAVRLLPNSADSYNNLGNALAQVPGAMPQAITEFETALRIRPEFAEAHYNLANALAHTPGRLPDAIAEYQAALRFVPEGESSKHQANVHVNLGNALAHMPDRLPDAIAEFRFAIRLQPDFAEAHYNLGNALARTPGRTSEAIAEFQAALRINPELAAAHHSLGTVLLQMPGRRAQAIEELEASLRITPDPELRRIVDQLEKMQGAPR